MTVKHQRQTVPLTIAANSAGSGPTVEGLFIAIESRLGVPRQHQRLFIAGGRQLTWQASPPCPTASGSTAAVSATPGLQTELFSLFPACSGTAPPAVLLVVRSAADVGVAAGGSPHAAAKGGEDAPRSPRGTDPAPPAAWGPGGEQQEVQFVPVIISEGGGEVGSPSQEDGGGQALPQLLVNCTYPRGYLPQDAFVCRSCIEAGLASPSHSVCAACVDVCHKGHTVEPWGRRLHMRCDCCTIACTGPAAQQCCRFVVPTRTRIPLNAANRYPPAQRTMQWCACRTSCEEAFGGPHAAAPNSPTAVAAGGSGGGSFQTIGGSSVGVDEDDAAATIAGQRRTCVCCSSNFWAPHLTDVCADLLWHSSCYGAVSSGGDTLVFWCRTCNGGRREEGDAADLGKYVCLPCRLRCHATHDVEGPTYWTTIAAGAAGGDGEMGSFFCACSSVSAAGCQAGGGVATPRGLAAHHLLPETDPSGTLRIGAFRAALRQECDGLPLASHILGDCFACFVCSVCTSPGGPMSWLLHERTLANPGGCCGGRLPSIEAAGSHAWMDPPDARSRPLRSLMRCAITDEEASGEEEGGGRPAAAFRHGVLLPSFFFSQLACGCDRCGRAFDAALPGWRQLDDPTAVVGVPASSSCSNCGSTLQPSSGSKSYFCLTCELENQGGDSYVLCQTCYDVRGSSGSAAAVMHDPQHILQEETVENLWSVMGTLIALHHHDDQERGPPRAPTPPALRTGADSLAAHTTGWIAAARETQARVLSECLAAVEGVTVKVAAPPAAGSTAGRKRPRPAAGSSRSSSSSPETPPPGDNGSQ